MKKYAVLNVTDMIVETPYVSKGEVKIRYYTLWAIHRDRIFTVLTEEELATLGYR